MRKRISVKREEEKFKKATLVNEGSPKSLLQEYFGFLCAEARDQQKFDEKIHGLRSFKRSQPTKIIPMGLKGEEIILYHCAKTGTSFSQVQLKDNLQSRLNRIRENVQKGKWSFVGNALTQTLFGEGVNCQGCKTRFSLKIIFSREKVPELLAKLLQSLEPNLGNKVGS